MIIIQIGSGTAGNVQAAQLSLVTMVHGWGHEIAEAPAEAVAAAEANLGDRKGLDPVSLTSLVLSIPSAVLAVQDLADRIRKRRRAKELIDLAQQLASQRVTINVMSRNRTVQPARSHPRSAPRPASRRRSSRLSQPPARCAVARGAVAPVQVTLGSSRL